MLLSLARARSLSLRRPFSSRGERGLLSFRCLGSSLQGLLWLRTTGSRARASVVAEFEPLSPVVAESEPVSPALADGFSTPRHQGGPGKGLFFKSAPVGREACLLQRAAPPASQRSWSPPPLRVLGAHPCRLLSEVSGSSGFCCPQPSGGT